MDWAGLEHFVLTIGNAWGLPVLGGAAAVLLLYKGLDAWGKRQGK